MLASFLFFIFINRVKDHILGQPLLHQKFLSMKLVYVFICVILGIHSYGQCDLDRHSTSISDSWISCEISPSPNVLRGDSHWIQYDLGEVRKLGSTHFWNISNPQGLDSGARQIAFAVSIDGIEWQELGIWEASIGNSSGFYDGEEGFDFDGAEGRFVLLTVLNSHGGDCVGFSELRVGFQESTSLSDLAETDSGIIVYPNPAIDQVTLTLLEPEPGEYLMSINDLSGRTLMEKSENITSGQNSIPVYIENIPNGQYIISLVSATRSLQAELTVVKN